MMQEKAERAYFLLCGVLGRLLRSGRYSQTRIVDQGGDASTGSASSRAWSRGDASTGSASSRAWSRDDHQVRKHRLFYAPLLVWMGGPLMSLLDTGVRVLPQRGWEERERRAYQGLYGTSIRIEVGGTLVLPCLAGEPLATLLEDPTLEECIRTRGIKRAVVALAELHRLGFTHGDAMAENVMVDLETAVAHWFDFETIHESSRSMAWRRADDVRALLVTCLIRTVPEKRAEVFQIILDAYADEGVTRLLAASFTSVLRRPLTFHLAQAGLSFQCFQEIARLLRSACADRSTPAR